MAEPSACGEDFVCVRVLRKWADPHLIFVARVERRVVEVHLVSALFHGRRRLHSELSLVHEPLLARDALLALELVLIDELAQVVLRRAKVARLQRHGEDLRAGSQWPRLEGHKRV